MRLSDWPDPARAFVTRGDYLIRLGLGSSRKGRTEDADEVFPALMMSPCDVPGERCKVTCMSWFMSKIYDRFMADTEQAALGQWRRELLSQAGGKVLEVGAGTGVNLPLYPSEVSELVITEPDRHMRARLQEKGVLPVRAKMVADAVGQLRMDDASIDTVVCTLVLCSVDDQPAALKDLFRVLRPGGKLLFIEHVAAESNPERLAWQRRIEPVWKRIAGNCHLTRNTAAEIERAGFELGSVQRESMRKALPWVRPSVRGVAVKPG